MTLIPQVCLGKGLWGAFKTHVKQRSSKQHNYSVMQFDITLC